MFRTLFRRPGAVKVPARNGVVEMQRVEIRRKPSKASTAVRQFAINAILFYCAFHTVKFWMYGPDPEVQKRYEELRKQRASQKATTQPSEHWTQQHNAISKPKSEDAGEKADADDDRIIIPIYGWIKKLEPRMLKPADAELKAFVALRNDERAMENLYQEVFQAVWKQIEKSKAHQRNLAMLDWNGRYQTNLHFGQMIRLHPYAMRCLIIEPGKIAMGWKELSPLDGARIQRLQQPLLLSGAFFKGLWAFTTTTAAIAQAKLVDTVYGQNNWTYRLLYRTQKGHTRYVGMAKPMNREENVISKLPSANMTDAEVQKLFPFLRGSFGQGTSKETFRSTAQSLMHQNVLQHSVHIFKHHLLAGQQNAHALSTPGTVPILGFFDFRSEKGIYRVEVMALYVLRENAFIAPLMITNAYFLYDSPKAKALLKDLPNQNQQPSVANHAHPENPSKRPKSVPESPEKDSSPGKDTGK